MGVGKQQGLGQAGGASARGGRGERGAVLGQVSGAAAEGTLRAGLGTHVCCGLCLGSPSGLGEQERRVGVTLKPLLWSDIFGAVVQTT